MDPLARMVRPVPLRQPAVRPTFAAVDPAAIAHNLRAVQTLVGRECRVLGVVKADAYGHGARTVARSLVGAGVWGLAVSLVEEGLELRDAGVDAPVVVLGGPPEGSEDMVVARRLRPVVWSPGHLRRLSAAVTRAGGAAVPVHLKIDTGMSRLGVLPRELGPILDWIVADAGRTLMLEGVCTHLACAGEAVGDPAPDEQIRIFRECLGTLATRGLTPRLRHVCNSAALVRFPAARLDMVRPGIALYGAAPAPGLAVPDLKPALALHTRVLGLRRLPAGRRVGYGGRHTLVRDSVLAILPVGYGDGYPRAASGRAQVLIRGERCPLLGDVSMDVAMADVTDLGGVAEGDPVTLLGAQGRERITAEDLAGWAGCLPYEVTCGLSRRVPRRPA